MSSVATRSRCGPVRPKSVIDTTQERIGLQHCRWCQRTCVCLRVAEGFQQDVGIGGQAQQRRPADWIIEVENHPGLVGVAQREANLVARPGDPPGGSTRMTSARDRRGCGQTIQRHPR